MLTFTNYRVLWGKKYYVKIIHKVCTGQMAHPIHQKSWGFDSWSGHILRLWFNPPLGCIREVKPISLSLKSIFTCSGEGWKKHWVERMWTVEDSCDRREEGWLVRRKDRILVKKLKLSAWNGKQRGNGRWPWLDLGGVVWWQREDTRDQKDGRAVHRKGEFEK